MNGTISVEGLLEPPSDEEVGPALLRFAKDLHEHYGSGLADLYLYGSRARAEHHLESDADNAQTISRDQAAAVIGTMIDFVAFSEKLLSK